MGGIIGVIFAFTFSLLIERYQFITLPDIYYLTTLPVKYDLWSYGSIFLGSIAISIIAGVYPAYAASRVRPTVGINDGRYTD